MIYRNPILQVGRGSTSTERLIICQIFPRLKGYLEKTLKNILARKQNVQSFDIWYVPLPSGAQVVVMWSKWSHHGCHTVYIDL